MVVRHAVFLASWAVSSVLALSGTADASVVRCTAADGRVTYQNSTCATGSRTESVDAALGQGITFADRKQIERIRKERAAERTRESRTRVIPSRERAAKAKPTPVNAGERRFITAGMNATEVRARIGAPDQTVRPSSSTSKPSAKDAMQRWVYLPAPEDPQTTTVLSVRGGVVTTVDRRVTR